MKQRGKILVVDAVPTNRIVMRSILSAAGYSVTVAADSGEAMAKARQLSPDAVLAAMNLNGQGAKALFARIRTLPKAPAILALAGSSIDARVAAFDIGADDVVSHPPDQALLLSRIRALIRVRKSNLLEDMFQMSGSGLSEPAAAYAPPPRMAVLCDDLDHGRAVQNALIRQAGGECDRFSLTALPARAVLDRYDAFVMVPHHDTPAPEILDQIVAARSTNLGRANVLLLAKAGHSSSLAARALDAGADDVVDGLSDTAEMGRRIKARLRSRRSLPTSCRDALTGLPNARFAIPVLARHSASAARSETPYSLLVAELSDPGAIRSRHGATQLDAVIAEISARLRVALRQDALLARLSDTEFMVLLPHTGSAEARRTALRLCHVVSESPCGLPGTQASIPARLAVGVSLGHLAGSGTAISRANTLIQHARLAVQTARQAAGDLPVQFGRPAA